MSLLVQRSFAAFGGSCAPGFIHKTALQEGSNFYSDLRNANSLAILLCQLSLQRSYHAD